MQYIFLVLILFKGFKVQAQQKICFGSTMRYSVDSFENSGRGSLGSTYRWSIQEASFIGVISNSFSGSTNDILINWGNSPLGNYTLIVNETDSIGCIGLNQTLKVEILALPPFNLSNQFICINPLTKELISPAVLDTKLIASEYGFNWQFNGNNSGTSPSIEVSNPGIYTVEIENLTTNCKALYEVKVALSSPSISNIKVDNFFEDTQRIEISVISGIGDYEYSIDGTEYQDSPSFDVTKGGVYTVYIRDKNGCSTENLQAYIVTYPKFFSPNNDGYFDFWTIVGLTQDMKPVVTIFNRFSKLLKVIRYGDEAWDGTYNGIELPSDDYWFVIEYVNGDGVVVNFKSHFALIR